MASDPIHHVFLVPGFFGFANLGDFYYFGHLVTEIEHGFRDRGVPVRVVRVPTHPTASLRHRTLRLHQAVVDAAPDPEAPIHLVGHSAGGLDARLFASPGTNLGPDVDLEPLAAQVRSVVTVSTPHYGTPIAAFLSEISGRRLVWLLSALTLHGLKFGHLPLSVGLKIGSIVTNLDRVGIKPSAIDQIYRELLADFSVERRDEVRAFFSEVTDDQSLITQLSPASMDVFNLTVGDRPGVRYGSVVTRARPPDLKGRLEGGLSVYAQATQSIYRVLHRRVSVHQPTLLPPVPPGAAPRLLERFGRLPGGESNDGIVPTRSQLWGELIDAAQGDHHDVIGHFDAPRHDPPHMDWLSTGSRFSRADFDRVWTNVLDFLLPGDPAYQPKTIGP